MRPLLLAPHFDDETLFASYAIQLHQPMVMVVAPPKDEDERLTREDETRNALTWMGISPASSLIVLGSHSEGDITYQVLASYLDGLVGDPPGFDPFAPGPGEPLREQQYSHVFAPLVEEGGHADHNLVGKAAAAVFPEDMVTYYSTYTRHGGRTTTGREMPVTPGMISRKLSALSCYVSQIEHPARRPWFYDMLPMREWYS